jgi:hypothetical protein
MQPQILLLSNNSEIIKDFEIAARLARAEPLIARTTSEAMRAINAQKISIIFFHGDLLGEGGGAVTFASELDNNQQTKSLPRYLLESRSEDPMHPQGRGCFTGIVSIPIEFPTFTETMQKLLNHHDSPAEKNISVEINIPTSNEATRVKVHLIKTIQTAVLEQIVQEIEYIEHSEICSKLVDITKKVSEKYSKK